MTSPSASARLAGKRVLVTYADTFMGPSLCEVLAEHGATVIASTDRLATPESPAAVVDPLPRLFRAVLPAMIERRAGKILVMGSAR